MKQRSLLREAKVRGVALHTGDQAQLTIKPAEAGRGIVFRRVDVHGKPEIPALHTCVSDLNRATTLSAGHAKIHTVEHVLAAFSGMGVDNAIVEMDASEPPILDGSAKGYVNAILEAEPVDLEAERTYFELDSPVSVTRGNSSLIALPYDGLKISCTSADDRGIHTQHLAIEVDPDVFATQLAAARTFTIYEDIEELLKQGKIRGGSLENAIVLKGDKILSKEPLRFEDELARHKILDIIGDLALIGVPLKAHIVAVRPGHAINFEATKKLAERLEEQREGRARRRPPPPSRATVVAEETELDIRRIIETLPHRYPFIMIDRVVEFRGEDELVAIKNVTINEEYFQGHFPGLPTMPGVLQIEAMAQAAGILLLRKTDGHSKTAFFMSIDKVKFRNRVIPGDQLRIEVKLLKVQRQRIGTASAVCYVGEKVVSSGELKFMIAELGEDI